MKKTVTVALLLLLSGCQKDDSQSSDDSETASSETASLPSVQCGSEECVTGDSGSTCCISAEGAGITEPECREDCQVVDQVKSYQALCDEHTDCKESQLCCVTGGKYTFVAECKEPNLCNWTDSSGGSVEVCKSPAMKSAISCSEGTACTKTIPGYTDWLFCELPEDTE